MAAGLWFADTDIGHRLIVDTVESKTRQSGLRIKIGRIEGSIYGKARLKTVQLYDKQGLFFDAPQVDLDWSPLRWINNRLDIATLIMPAATLHKIPKLQSNRSNAPLLPGFDIHMGMFKIDRLRIAAGITGVPQRGRISGGADIISGRAQINLTGDTSGGDHMMIRLDAQPERDIFNCDALLHAPAGGVLATLTGYKQSADIKIEGDGTWRKWSGYLNATAAGVRVAALNLTNDAGMFGMSGRIALATLTVGKLQRLTNPVMQINAKARLENRVLNGTVWLGSGALAIGAQGQVDLAANRFNPIMINAKLIRSDALFPNMTGGPLILKARLDGAFATARFDYLLSANRLSFGATGFENIRASGQGRLSPAPIIVPVRLSASRVSGIGTVAGGILNNLSVVGDLRVTAKTITADALRLTSDKLSSTLTLLLDLAAGRYDVGFAGALERYFIAGLGVVDVRTTLKIMPGAGRQGVIIAGRGQAWVRRLDNAFLASLTGGLPQIETGLVRGGDGVLRFTNMRLTAPNITLTGNGIRRNDGTFQFEASGRQARYGPIAKLLLDGRIERPRLDITFSRPNDAMGLAGVRLRLDPSQTGYIWDAAGRSMLGMFSGRGAVGLPNGRAATLNVAMLNVSGMQANGALVSRTGGFDGRLNISGSGVLGTLDFAPLGNFQRIEAHLKARDAVLAGPPVMRAGRGQIDAVMLLDPAGLAADATVSGQGLVRGGLRLARLAANIKLRGGGGEIRASFAGSRGRAFNLQTIAQFSPDTVQVIGSGTIDRKPLRLISPAVLNRENGGWRLRPATIDFGGGQVQASGLFGTGTSEFDATLTGMPLTILDIISPELGLGGVANGTLSYRSGAGGAPNGKANIKVNGLTRSGLALTSKPVDVGVAAVLSANNAAARVIAVSGGQIIGRGQIKLSPGAGADLMTRLRTAPMFAQLRFSGAADTLWRLTGIEALDVSGPVAVGADVTGTLNDPVIAGSLRTNGARIENAVTGTVLTGVKASGHFGGSTLVIDDFTSTSGKDGSVNGRAKFDFSSARGLAMDIRLQAIRANLIARDELSATVSGPITLTSDARGGLIAGDIVLDRSAYRLGRAANAVAAIAQLNIVEINDSDDAPLPRANAGGWRLAIKARAPNRLAVSGLGIDSEWRAVLDIGGSVTAPVIQGQADLVRGGYEFAGRRFDLSRGILRFQGESPPDPVLDIVANGDTQGLNAIIRVTGTGQRPDVAFSSTPALPQDELLSRLLFGTSITNLSAPEALQLASAVASLRGGGGLNPINALRKAIGLDRLRILPADTTTGQGTAIAAGKYLTRRAYFEIITDGQGYSATRAEYQITRWLSLLSTISNIGRQSVTLKVSKDY